MRRSFPAVLLFVLLSAALVPDHALHAQASSDRLTVRTFTLQSLSPKDAAQLVGPYVTSPGGGVYEAGGALRAITVRGPSEILARVDSILRANDHARATLVLRFQLIAASDSAVHDPAISAIDTELRNLFRFAGYRLLSQGSATVNDGEPFSLTMGGVRGEVLRLGGQVMAAQPSGGKGTAQLYIRLERPMNTMVAGSPTSTQQMLLSTGLTLPLGQTVVLGSAAYGAPIPAIILAVRPEVAGKP